MSMVELKKDGGRGDVQTYTFHITSFLLYCGSYIIFVSKIKKSPRDFKTGTYIHYTLYLGSFSIQITKNF